MANKIKLKLNKLQWTFLANNIKIITAAAPVEDWEIESCVIADCYKRLLQNFTFFPTGKHNISISLKYSEAYAINNYFSATSTPYNVLLRMSLESKLPTSKAQPNEEV